jgi:hypothetical protein
MLFAETVLHLLLNKRYIQKEYYDTTEEEDWRELEFLFVQAVPRATDIFFVSSCVPFYFPLCVSLCLSNLLIFIILNA